MTKRWGDRESDKEPIRKADMKAQRWTDLEKQSKSQILRETHIYIYRERERDRDVSRDDERNEPREVGQ